MKETKVYVDELPESCDECKYYTQFTDGMGCIVAQELRPMDECDNYMQASCPLQSIKDHDRELVKEVCEKIKERAVNMYYAEDQEDDSIEQAIVISRNEAVDEFIDILDQIQKEFEK